MRQRIHLDPESRGGGQHRTNVVSGYAGCDDASTCAIEVDGWKGSHIPAADLEIGDGCDDNPLYGSTDVVLSSSDALEVVLSEYTIRRMRQHVDPV